MKRDFPEWRPEVQQRLIELFRLERRREEIARELGLPLDVIEERIQLLQLEGDIPHRHF